MFGTLCSISILNLVKISLIVKRGDRTQHVFYALDDPVTLTFHFGSASPMLV